MLSPANPSASWQDVALFCAEFFIGLVSVELKGQLLSHYGPSGT